VTKKEPRSMSRFPFPRATVNRYVPSGTNFEKRTTISVSLARTTRIFSVSQKTTGICLPKFCPCSVTVSLSRFTIAEVTSTGLHQSSHGFLSGAPARASVATVVITTIATAAASLPLTVFITAPLPCPGQEQVRFQSARRL
jgi:hypothetical protein